MAEARTCFGAPWGRAVPAATAAEMREIGRVAAGEAGPGLARTTERAGLELALAALAMLGGDWAGARVAVLAGAGGNGGGGLCAARCLASRGVGVLAVLARPPAALSGVPAAQLRTLREAPARVIHWSDAFDIGEADLVIDAIVGCGLRGAPAGPQLALIRAAQAAAAPVLSLDVPSGVDPDTGEVPGVAVRAARTLALALPKRGLRRANAGELWLADLGIPPGVFARAGLAFPSPFGPRSQVPLRYPDEDRSGGEADGRA